MKKQWHGDLLLKFVLWATGIASVGGLLLARPDQILINWLLIGCIAMAAFDFCLMANRERCEALARGKDAEEREQEATRRQRESEDRLNHAAEAYVARIDEAVAWRTLARAIGSIEWMFDVVSRLIVLKGRMDEFRVLSLRPAGETVYVVAEVIVPLLQHIQRHDPFLLVAIAAGGVEHVVAKLRADQLGNVKGCVVFAVTEIRDDIFNKLVAPAGMSDLDLTKGYRVRLPEGVEIFGNLNLAAVKDGIAVAKEAMLSDSKGAVTWKQ